MPIAVRESSTYSDNVSFATIDEQALFDIMFFRLGDRDKLRKFPFVVYVDVQNDVAFCFFARVQRIQFVNVSTPS